MDMEQICNVQNVIISSGPWNSRSLEVLLLILLLFIGHQEEEKVPFPLYLDTDRWRLVVELFETERGDND